jgi:hypothetical protein
MDRCRHFKPPQFVFQLIVKRMVGWVDGWNIDFLIIQNPEKSVNSGKKDPEKRSKPPLFDVFSVPSCENQSRQYNYTRNAL